MRFLIALFLAVTFHGLLAVACAILLEGFGSSRPLPQLDLSSVELSLAEKDDSSAAVQAHEPAEPTPQRKVETPTVEQPILEPLVERPRSPDELALPEPEKEQMETPPPRPQPALEAPRQARVDAPPRPKHTIRPDYPKGARQRGEQGDTVVEFEVSAKGRVESVRTVVSSGFPELDDAAVRAVQAARFIPARADRQAVSATARLKLTFRLTSP